MSNFEKFMHFLSLYLAASGNKSWCTVSEARSLRKDFPEETTEPIDCEQRAWDVFYWLHIHEGLIKKPDWVT